MASGPKGMSALRAEAVSHHAAGRLSHAESAYRRLLAADPNDAAALHGLGLIALAADHATAGLELLERAVRLQRDNPEFLSKLGSALAMSGRLDEANTALHRAVALDPRNVEARFNLGLVLLNTGANEKAAAAFADVVRAAPRHVNAWLNKGIAHVRLGESDEGHRCLARAHALAPNDSNVRLNYANVLRDTGRLEDAAREYRALVEHEPHNLFALYNLAATLKDLGRSDQALGLYERVLALDPDNLDAHNNIGVAKLADGRVSEALVHFERVLREKPHDAAALGNKASALNELERPAEALEILNSLIVRTPDDIATAAIRANVLMALGDLEGADAAFADVLARAPNHPTSLYGRALCKLRLREFDQGFDLFEHRWGPDAPGPLKRAFPLPEWEGPGHPGPVLIWLDQGVGDQIMCAALLPLLAERNISFAYECDERLLPLLRRSFTQFAFLPPLSPATPPPAGFAAHLPAGSLMHRLKPWPAGTAHRTRYLESDPGRRRAFAAELSSLGKGPRIGISWRSTRRLIGTDKTMSLDLWHPILAEREAVFVNLQYGETDAEIDAAQAATGAIISTAPSIDRFSDIDGLAALIDALDLVITTSNLTAHLAGALGKECWLALQHVPLWYWAFDGEVPHVYGSIRTFRQKKTGDWTPVIADLSGALTARLANKNQVFDA